LRVREAVGTELQSRLFDFVRVRGGWRGECGGFGHFGGGPFRFRAFEVAIDRPRRNAKQSRSPIFVTARVTQRNLNSLSFQFFEWCSDFVCQRVPRFGERGDALWESRKRNRLAVGEDNGAFNSVF
jgi:hypothetical protein